MTTPTYICRTVTKRGYTVVTRHDGELWPLVKYARAEAQTDDYQLVMVKNVQEDVVEYLYYDGEESGRQVKRK